MNTLVKRAGTELVNMYLTPSDFHLRCEGFITMLCSRVRTELLGCILNSIYAVKVSPPCSAAGPELKSWECVFNPLEFHVPYKRFTTMPCNRVQTEFMVVYFQFARIPFTL